MSGAARRAYPRASDGVALALVAAAFAAGALAYGAAPAEVVVHYTPPGGVYYGPETLPKAVGLFALPVASVAVFGIMRTLPLLADVDEQLAPVRPYYRAGTVLAVACLCAGQAVLVAVNVA